jgi:hypothetical protein
MTRRAIQYEIPPFAHFAYWPWWKVLGTGFLAHGVLGGLMVLMPPFPSVRGLVIGLGLGFVGLVGRLACWRTNVWWTLVAYTQVVALHFVGLAVVGLAYARRFSWTWLLPVGALYFTALAMPVVARRLSDFLWREMTTPLTRIGRGCLAVGLVVLPIAGVLGGSVGLWARRWGLVQVIMPLGMGCLGIMAATIVAFSFSYQLWPLRPWAKKEEGLRS